MLIRLGCLFAVFAALGGGPASAAPPAGTPDATPDAPAPALCTAPAPSFAQINQLMATPQAFSSPVASPPPAAPPASPEQIAAVTGVVRELIACLNAGRPLNADGLYTDAYLRHLFAVEGAPSQTAYTIDATPEPLPAAGYVQILAIAKVVALPSGAVRANVTLRYAGIPVPKTFAFEFVETSQGWRINAALGEITFSLP